jgi:hypothetical protein
MTTRIFTVEVTGCMDCPFHRDESIDSVARCIRVHVGQVQLARENEYAITPTCPMWNEAKPIGELK